MEVEGIGELSCSEHLEEVWGDERTIGWVIGAAVEVQMIDDLIFNLSFYDELVRTYGRKMEEIGLKDWVLLRSL